jgi:hypothetical protein
LSRCFLLLPHRTTHPSDYLTCAALNQAREGRRRPDQQPGGPGILQGKNAGGINQGKTGEGGLKNFEHKYIRQVFDIEVMGTLQEQGEGKAGRPESVRNLPRRWMGHQILFPFIIGLFRPTL